MERELLIRQVPHSIEAEQAVLGSIVIDPACVPTVLGMLSPDDFYIDVHKMIYETVVAMFTMGKKIDYVTILDEIKMSGNKGKVDRDFFLKLVETTPTSANVEQYADIVRGKSMLRDLQSVSSEIMELTKNEQEDPQNVAELAEQKVYSVRQGREIKGLISLKSAIKDVYDTLDELALHPGQIPGVTTGFSSIDNFIGGLNKGELVLLAARPAMGKTSMVLNMATSAARSSGKTVVIFQLEMSKEQLATRMLSSEALVDSKKLRMGTLDEKDWIKIAGASEKLSKLSIRIDDNSAISISEMKAKCRRLGDRLGLVVIDYLQLMQGSRRTENRVQEVSEISRGLKIMAKELNVPVLCCSQLSRASESRKDKRPMLSDLRESGAIEQDADIVMFLYRDDYYDPENGKKNVAECIIAKNRHGEIGTVELQWLGQFTAFTSQDTVHNES